MMNVWWGLLKDICVFLIKVICEGLYCGRLYIFYYSSFCNIILWCNCSKC